MEPMEPLPGQLVLETVGEAGQALAEGRARSTLG
jgi:hypothetical protein